MKYDGELPPPVKKEAVRGTYEFVVKGYKILDTKEGFNPDGTEYQEATKYSLELALPAFPSGPGSAYMVYDTFSVQTMWKVASYCKAVKRPWNLGELEPQDCVAHTVPDKKGQDIIIPAHRGVVTIEPKTDYVDKATGEKKTGKGFFVKLYVDPAQPVPLTLRATKADWDSILVDVPETDGCPGPGDDDIPF